jgi:hypothetical protein
MLAAMLALATTTASATFSIVARDPATGELAGGGDPRRGGSVALA